MRQRSKRSLAAAGVLALGVSIGAHATSYEYTHIYKDQRALGMGGASVAVGGGPGAVFSNPAGLMRARRGLHIDLLPLRFGGGGNVRGFFDDMSDALDLDDDDEQREAVSELLREYRGRNLHFDSSVFPTITWRGDNLALTAGYLVATQFNGRAHQGFGSEGLLSVNAQGYHGPIFGAAYEYGRFSLGTSVKMLTRHTLNERYTPRELVEYSDDHHPSEFEDDVFDGNAVGLDVGMLYEPFPGHPLKPTLGFSVLNVGGMDFGPAGEIPMTTNVGVSLSPQLPLGFGFTLAADYLDVFGEREQDDDILKRLHLGAEAVVLRRSWADIAVQGGLYQTHPTAGIEMRFALVSLAVTTYAEEVGAYAGQDADRRYLATLTLGW